MTLVKTLLLLDMLKIDTITYVHKNICNPISSHELLSFYSVSNNYVSFTNRLL